MVVKTVSAMVVRRHFGGLLDEVRTTAQPVLIERDGCPMAVLAPLPVSLGQADERHQRQLALERLCGLSNPTSRGRDPQAWLDQDRSAWAERKP